MKQFSLDEYLKNPSRKVVTRMGRKVRIICTDREDSIYPIVALVKDDKRELEILVAYTKDGLPAEYVEEYYTLFFAPEKHEGWAVIHGNFITGRIFSSKEEAEEYVKGVETKIFIAPAKIEWEE